MLSIYTNFYIKTINTKIIMNQNKKREYTSPTIEMLDARVEKGFAGSRFNGTTPHTIGEKYNNGGDNSSLFF